MIRPRCQECGRPADKSVAPVDGGPPENYCSFHLHDLFVANIRPAPRPAEEVSAGLAARHITGTGSAE